jgi:hypothetical protein
VTRRTRSAGAPRAPRRAVVLLALAAGACRGGFAAEAPDATSAPRYAAVAIDTSQRFQAMTGWEATVQAGQDFRNYARFRDTVLDRAIALGINRLRLHARSGSEYDEDTFTRLAKGVPNPPPEWRCVRFATVNDNADPRVLDPKGFHFSEMDHEIETVVLPFRDRLARRGERLFLNVNYNAFTGQICGARGYHHADPEEYAEFVLATHLHLKARWGLVPDAWEVLLEPDNVRQWNAPLMGRAIVAAARRLREAGFATKFIVPSNTNMTRALEWFDQLATVPGATDEIAEVAWHRYGGVTEQALRGLGARARQLGVPGAMLEHIGAGYESLHDDLEYGHAGAWEQFALAYPVRKDDGSAYLLIRDPDSANPRVVENSTVAGLRQYFPHIRLGAVRVGATSPARGLRPLAFVNADGRMVLVTRVDARGARFSVTGLRAGAYGISWYERRGGSGRHDDVRVAEGEALNVVMPGTGVLTIAAR